jgi:hypothetical protein
MCGYKPRHAPLVGSRLRCRSGSLAMLLAKRAGILMSASLLIRSMPCTARHYRWHIGLRAQPSLRPPQKIRASYRRFEMCKTYPVDETNETFAVKRIVLQTKGTNLSTKDRRKIWATNFDTVFEHHERDITSRL